MINGLKPYPTYKDSGVPWLGSIPTHWAVRRGKGIFRCIDIRSSTGAEELLTVSSERGVIPRKSATVTMFKAETYVGYKLCWPGDLVINSLWAWSRGLGVSRYHGIVSSAYGVYRLRPEFVNHSAFIHELVRSSPFQWELQVRSKGIWISRLQLTDESFLEAPFPLPPADEQAAIVRFLNYVGQRIRRYINAKKKLIALLNEQKQAIILKAVTRGLDPSVRFKASGVEWLGEVPEHWGVRKIKHVTKQIVDGTHFTPTYLDDGIPFLRVTDIQSAQIDQKKLRRISYEEHIKLNKRCNPERGDVLLSKNGTIGLTKVVDWDFPCSIFVSLCLLKVIHSLVNPQFLSFAFDGGILTQQLAHVTKTTSVTNLHLEKIKELVLPIPPVDEQLSIIEATNKKLAPYFQAINAAIHEINLIKEYRTRLIADVVTGKLDVREAAAQLPDEIIEPGAEAIDEEEDTIEADTEEFAKDPAV